MKIFIKQIAGLAVSCIKLDPVKAVLYQCLKIGSVLLLKQITKSTKNKLDDKAIKPIIKAIEKGNA